MNWVRTAALVASSISIPNPVQPFRKDAGTRSASGLHTFFQVKMMSIQQRATHFRVGLSINPVLSMLVQFTAVYKVQDLRAEQFIPVKWLLRDHVTGLRSLSKRWGSLYSDPGQAPHHRG